MILWYLIAALIAGLVLSSEYYRYRTGVPTVASFAVARQKIIEILRQRVAPNASINIIDLGSGNGQLATLIAHAFPETQVTGIELSPVPYLISAARQKLSGPANIRFKRVDFFTYDCAAADVVMVFLTENIIGRVSEKLRKELKKGALILANETPLTGDWQSVATEEFDVLKIKTKIFIYQA